MNVGENVEKVDSGIFSKFDRIAFCSVHTTAGFLEQPFALKLGTLAKVLNHLFARLADSSRKARPTGMIAWNSEVN